MVFPLFLGLTVFLRDDESFVHLSYRSGKEPLSSFIHGLNPNSRAFAIFPFVSGRHGFAFSILSRVIIDKLALLASSDLLVFNLS